MNDFQEIYDSFCDEESKLIFLNRLMYAATQDYKFYMRHHSLNAWETVLYAI